jgi:formamidopyrimidine-DNA glycosylase
MPELPEVETIRRTLTPRLVGRTIKSVEVRTPKFIVGASPEEFRGAVEGARIDSLGRRGKFLIINLEYPAGRGEGHSRSATAAGRHGDAFRVAEGPADSAAPGVHPRGDTAPSPGVHPCGRRPTDARDPVHGSTGGAQADGEPAPTGLPGDIVVHLKMAGQLVWCRPGEDLGPTRTKHTHVVFHLDDGHELRYIDLRHFGRVYFPPGNAADPVLSRTLRTIQTLGPEPREGGLEWESFRRKLARRHARIKPLLLDQAFVAGLGNIYADECLFRAKVHPLRRASTLTDAEAAAIYEAMREVIGEAIDRHGTSVRDYVDGEGRRGMFAEELQAYGRTGQPCPRCGEPIERLMIGGRSSHFCPKCQPRT